jgi:phage-related baseplate assembly protein
MGRFTEIDLTGYPLPAILEVLTVETYLARNKVLFAAAWDAIRGDKPPIDTLALEHEPVTAQLRVAAELERMLRGQVNDRIKQVTLAGARGALLDHLAMTYFGGLKRRVITPAVPLSGTPAVLEDDETFRQRVALSPESWSTCGPEGAYLFWALAASGDVLDVAIYSEDEGVCLAPRIVAVVLGREGLDQTAQAAMLTAVENTLNDPRLRPKGDVVRVQAATVIAFDVSVILSIRPGASADVVRAEAETRLRAYCEGYLRWIGDGLAGPVWIVGRRLSRSTMAARAMGDDPNIGEVEIIAPTADINAPAAGYEAALADVGEPDFVPLDPALTAHLFRAPRLDALTITTRVVRGGGLA